MYIDSSWSILHDDNIDTPTQKLTPTQNLVFRFYLPETVIKKFLTHFRWSDQFDFTTIRTAMVQKFWLAKKKFEKEYG